MEISQTFHNAEINHNMLTFCTLSLCEIKEKKKME